MKALKNFIRLLLREDEPEDDDKYELNKIADFVDEQANNLIKTDPEEFLMTPEESKRVNNKRELFKMQYELCGVADLSAKQFMKGWISDLITQIYGINEKNIDKVINFDFPNVYCKFLIILHSYMNNFGYKALEELIISNKLDQLKEVNGDLMFAITKEDIDDLYVKESLNMMIISFEEKLNVLVQLIYGIDFGLSVIDELVDQKKEGISIGVDGIPREFISKLNTMKIKEPEKEYKLNFSYDSVWLYFKGKEIPLKFLTFGSQSELERVCKKLYTFDNQRQFSKKDGYIYNYMADFGRVIVFRPELSDSWAAVIRNYDIDGDLDNLITGENSDIVQDLIKYSSRGKKNIVFTGQKGVGKTTMLVAAIKEMYPNVAIRVWEAFFEIFLRFRLQNRNSITLREVEGISNERALEGHKKANGQVMVISEAADDQTVSYIIKSALVGSEAVYSTYHNETADGLVQSWRNAGINNGDFRDENVAEDQVLEVLEFESHLKSTPNGHRYIQRYTEFNKVNGEPYSEIKDETAFFENSRKYYERKTGAKKYKAVNLIEYDLKNKAYIIKNMPSEQRINEIRENLMDYDKEDFEKFLNRMKSLIVS